MTSASANHPAGSFLNCEPETETNRTGQNHDITCTLRDAAGAAVNAQPAAVTVRGEIDCTDNDCANATYTPGAPNGLDGDANDPAPANGDQPAGTHDDDRGDPDGQCVIQQGSSACTFNYTRNDAGTDEITFWIQGDGGETDDEGQAVDDQDSVDTVAKTWEAPAPTTTTCTPANATNRTGTSHTVTCQTVDQDGNPIAPTTPFVVNDPNNTSTAQNNCTQMGTTGTTQCTVQNNGTPGTVTFTQCPSAGAPAGSCGTATKTFQAPEARGVDAVPETANNQLPGDNTHTVTCTVSNQFAGGTGQGGPGAGTQGTQGTTCFFEFFEGSASDPFNDGNTPNTPDRQCTTQAATPNTCSITYTFGQNANTTTDATDAICVFITSNNQTPGTQTGTINMTGTATNPTCDSTQDAQVAESFTDASGDQASGSTSTTAVQPVSSTGGCTPQNAGTNGQCADDRVDVVQKNWTAGQQANTGAAQTIDAEPETDTNPVGTRHDIYVIARDPQNAGTQGQTTTQGATTNCTQAANAGATGACPTRVRADILQGSPNANTAPPATEIQCASTGQNVAGIQPGTTPSATNATHICSYVGTNPGTDQIMVFYDTNDNGLFEQGEPSDQVAKTWGGQPFNLALTPDADTATAGTCNEFTVTVTDAQGNPITGQFVDVQQTLQNAQTAAQENRELYFCDPQNATGPNPTGQGTTQFRDSPNTNPLDLSNQPARNTTRHAEVGPTNSAGQVTFGIGIRCEQNNADTACITQPATVSVRAWVDMQGGTACPNNQPNGTGCDNDVFDAGEPSDQPSTKTWNQGGGAGVTGLNAEPETATNPNGTQHTVTVTVTGAGGAPVQGVTPNSTIVTNPGGRPQGDVADPNSGTSPNATQANQGNMNVYNCTASNAQGVSTCTFNDPLGTPTGTDTIVFFVNQGAGGTPGPDTNEPQDAVQKTWTSGPQNLQLDVTCAGSGTNDTQDLGQQVGDNPANPDCTNPLNDPDEVFTAQITNAQGIGQQNIRVDFSFGQRTNGNAAQAPPNGNSTNDATLSSGAGGGGQIGTNPANLQTFCLTDATGRCSVTLTNPTPQAGDTIEVIGVISGQTVGGPAQDGATKQWQTGVVFQGGTLTLTPRAATNQVNTPHTVTATVRDQFGRPVQGANVDFRITNGPNQGLAQAGMLDATTDANGVATFTYTSSITGTDTIVACSETGGSENDTCNPGAGPGQGEPTATATKTWQTGPVTTAAVNLDMQARTQDANGADTVNDDCEVTTLANANREKTATNQVNPNVATGAQGATNFHEICAAAFQSNSNTPTAGADITFSITGVGRIFAVNAQGQCSTNRVPAAGTTLTVTADGAGIARACLYSQQVGRTTVTASSGNPAQTDTGTKDWTVNPATARFIQLCHGDVAGTTCNVAPATNAPGTQHQMTARVTDRQGNPVANVPVQFRETGPAVFIPQGGSTATVNTDANGLANVIIRSEVEGTSTVVAEIMSGSGAGGARGAGATDDECEAPAGTNNQPAAGNCISQSLTKNWTQATTPPPTSPASPAPPEGGWERDVDLQASKNRKRFGKSFTLSGTVELRDASNAPASCRVGVPVEIRRDVLGGNNDFVLFDTLTTDAQGAFTADYTADRSANYIAFVGHSGTGSAECAEGSSSPEPVLVRVAVRFKISDSKVKRGQRVRLRVKVLPCEGHEGDKVLIFKSIQGKFGKIAKKRTNDNCVAKFRKKVWKDTVFQARWPKQHADHLLGKSRPKAVQVRGRRR